MQNRESSVLYVNNHLFFSHSLPAKVQHGPEGVDVEGPAHPDGQHRAEDKDELEVVSTNNK